MAVINFKDVQFKTVEQMIKENIRFKQHWNKKAVGMKDAVWQPLVAHTNIEGITFKQGCLFKVFETNNFGWLVFHSDTAKTIDGNIPDRKIFKF